MEKPLVTTKQARLPASLHGGGSEGTRRALAYALSSIPESKTSGFPTALHMYSTPQTGPHGKTQVALISECVSLGGPWNQPLCGDQVFTTSLDLLVETGDNLLSLRFCIRKPNSHRAEKQVSSIMSTTGQWMSLLRRRNRTSTLGDWNSSIFTVWLLEQSRVYLEPKGNYFKWDGN